MSTRYEGPKPGTPEMARYVQASIDRAIAEGRHARTRQTVCTGCRRWVDAIYFVTEGKDRLCRDCTLRIGIKL